MKERDYEIAATMTHPNIILIILDAVRASKLSSYGYVRQTTPHIDEFATHNMLFKRAYAPGTWTIPTHASMLSGLYLSQHRIENIKADRRFNENVVTLPQALQGNGYRTAAFSQNILFSPKHHIADFGEFHSLESILESEKPSRRLQEMADNATGIRRKIARYIRKARAPRTMLEAMFKWIGKHEASAPFFLTANLTNVHYPWAVPPKHLRRRLDFNPKHLLNPDFTSIKPFEFNSGKRRVTDRHRHIWSALYDTALTHVDEEIGRFLRQLQRHPSWKNSIVIITADHGEMLGDYRDITGHTLCLHNHLIHVPFVVRHPDFQHGQTVEGVVQTIDLFSSIMDWSRTPATDIPAIQKQRPALDWAMAAPGDSSGFAFAEEDYTDSYDVLGGLQKVNPTMPADKYPRRQVAVCSATHKYIWNNDRQHEFYDMRTDSLEYKNLMPAPLPEQKPHLVALQQAFKDWQSNLEIFPPRPVAAAEEMEDVVIERLKTLGYIA